MKREEREGKRREGEGRAGKGREGKGSGLKRLSTWTISRTEESTENTKGRNGNLAHKHVRQMPTGSPASLKP